MRQKFGDDWARIAKLSIIEESPSGEKFVRMAYLAVIASSHINGVAAIHSGARAHHIDARAGRNPVVPRGSTRAWRCSTLGNPFASSPPRAAQTSCATMSSSPSSMCSQSASRTRPTASRPAAGWPSATPRCATSSPRRSAATPGSTTWTACRRAEGSAVQARGVLCSRSPLDPHPHCCPPPPSPCPQELRKFADESSFQAKWRAVKAQAKLPAIDLIEKLTNMKINNKDALLDVQVRTGGGGGGMRHVPCRALGRCKVVAGSLAHHTGQAHSRVQAAAAERAGHHPPLRPHPQHVERGEGQRGAPHLRHRRQGGARLRDGQAHHQAGVGGGGQGARAWRARLPAAWYVGVGLLRPESIRRDRCVHLPSCALAGERRPRGGRPAEGGVCARLQCVSGRAHHPRHRAEPAHLHGRHRRGARRRRHGGGGGRPWLALLCFARPWPSQTAPPPCPRRGQRHRQHEVCDERRTHHRHHGRRQH